MKNFQKVVSSKKIHFEEFMTESQLINIY